MKKFIVDTGDKKYKVEANDAEHATKLVKIACKDARRINYDDDIIKVTLNGKEVFKGYAEDWIDDDFYSAFKWTGSQYEASNSKGKWVVKVIDSFKDDQGIRFRDAASPLQTVNALLEDERAAVDAYNVALENLKGKIPDESYAAIESIRNDENRHIENLQAVVNGNVTEKNLKDAVKNNLDEYRSAIKEAVDELQKINGKYNEQDEVLVRSVLRKATAAIARAKSNYEKWI